METKLRLTEYLAEKTKNKEIFSLKELKQSFKKDKDKIAEFCFYGLIEPINVEFPDSVKANIYIKPNNK